VAERLVEPGTAVDAGTPILDVTGDGALEVFVDVPETRVRHVDRDATHRVRIPALDETVSGTVAGIASEASDAGTFPVRLSLDHAELRPGMSAEVSFALQRDETLRVPRASVGYLPDGQPYALVIERGVVTHRPLELGEVRDDTIAVRSGLDAGERIVRRGVVFLDAGEQVRVLSEARPSPASSARRRSSSARFAAAGGANR